MANEVPVEKLVKVYIKMREKQAEMASAFKEQEEALKDKMAKVKGALLEHCKEHNVESVRTADGQVHRRTPST